MLIGISCNNGFAWKKFIKSGDAIIIEIKKLPVHIGRPLVIMDGYALPMKDGILEFLNGLNPADIDFIEVLRGGEAGIYGVRGGSGVISINTKHGPDKTDYGNSNLRVFTPVTYHVCPKFEMPDYSNKESIKKNRITT